MQKQKMGYLFAASFLFALSFSLVPGNISKAASQKLNKTKVCLEKGGTCKLKLSGKKCSTTWSSSKKKVATVNKNGKVTAKKAGKATITAKTGKKKFCCKVTVPSTKTSGAASGSCTNNTASSGSQSSCIQLPGLGSSYSLPLSGSGTSCSTPQIYIGTPSSATQFPSASSVAQPASNSSAGKTQQQQASSSTSAASTSSTVTEERAYQILNSLRSTYPEGMTLTNSYYYYSKVFGNGYGCYGFAAKLSDTIFGETKPYTTHADFSKIRVGDNIRISNSHSVICLTKSSDYITVVEGNYNSSVHWDRKITKSSLASSGFLVYTRY